jgi:hypothetical protein
MAHGGQLQWWKRAMPLILAVAADKGCIHGPEASLDLAGWNTLSKLDRASCSFPEIGAYLAHYDVRRLANGQDLIVLLDRENRQTIQKIDGFEAWNPENAQGLRLHTVEVLVSYDLTSDTLVTVRDDGKDPSAILFRVGSAPVAELPFPSGYRYEWPDSGTGYLSSEKGDVVIGLASKVNSLEEYAHQLSPPSLEVTFHFIDSARNSTVFYHSGGETETETEAGQAILISDKPHGLRSSLTSLRVPVTDLADWGVIQISDSRYLVWLLQGDTFGGDSSFKVSVIERHVLSGNVQMKIVEEYGLPIGNLNVATPVVRQGQPLQLEYLGWLDKEKVLFRFPLVQGGVPQAIGFVEEEGMSIVAPGKAIDELIVADKGGDLPRYGVCDF